MKIKFWGVRGSIPVPGPSTVRYGGNTTCVEIRGMAGECIILDAGTGLRCLGMDLLQRVVPLPEINILISHTHLDHIHGFPFFAPCYIPGTKIYVKGPEHFLEKRSLKDIFDTQMQYDFFPVSRCQLDADIYYEAIAETSFMIGNIEVAAIFSNHPVRCLAYRISEQGRSMVFTGDHEPYYNLFGASVDKQDDILFGDVEGAVEEMNNRFLDFICRSDLFVVDCQYTPEEYSSGKRGWGHSSWDYCIEWMKRAEIARMVLTHHDPARTDDELDSIYTRIRKAAYDEGLDASMVIMAMEGLELEI